METITQTVAQLGFPIAACLAMAWYVKYITDKNCKQIEDMNKQHATDMQGVTQAVNNNTIALTHLIAKLEVK